MLDKVRTLTERITCKKLDMEVNKLYTDINSALNAACPKFKIINKTKKTEWYTDKIALLHGKVKRQYKIAIETGVREEWKKYDRLRRKFRRRCRRSKTITWRKFVNDTTGEAKMAVLGCIALHRDKRNLNVLYQSNGNIMTPGLETIDRLAEVHFTQSEPFDRHPAYNLDRAAPTTEVLEKFPFIDEKSVRRSVRKFKPNKAPGPDQLKPIVFRYFPPKLLTFFVFRYKACLHLHYTPRKWQEAIVVFIPKIGKKDYREAKSHRPIVLSNFVLKGLERIVTWRVDDHLNYYPIHPMQHGFQIGKGTEAALSSTCCDRR